MVIKLHMFTNEDAALYICRYLHPNDITALARASRDIRATIVPHMRYVVKRTNIVGNNCRIVRKDVIRPRFDRRDTSFKVVSERFNVYPNPIPRDYTGIVHIRERPVCLMQELHISLWASGGIVRREISWYNILDIWISVMKPVDVISYICEGMDVHSESHPDEDAIIDMIRDLHAKLGASFEYDRAFENLVRDIDSM